MKKTVFLILIVLALFSCSKNSKTKITELNKDSTIDTIEVSPYLELNKFFSSDSAITAIFDQIVRKKYKDWKGYRVYDWSKNDKQEQKGWQILQSIDTLNFKDEDISILPKEILACPNLKHLNLIGNNLDWDSTFSLISQTKVNSVFLSIDDISKINSKYWHYITGVKIIKFLNKFPKNILNFKQLQYIDISGTDDFYNDIDILPPELYSLKNLKYLNLAYCKLKTLPDNFSKLSNLEFLDLRGNYLDLTTLLHKLPLNIKQLGISIFKNDSAVFDILAEWKNLKSLILDVEDIDTLSKEIGKLTFLTKLDLSNNHLKYLPDEFLNLTNLTTLDLTNDYYLHLDSLKISRLHKLTSLYVKGVDINYLLFIKQIKNLKLENLSISLFQKQGYEQLLNFLASSKTLKSIQIFVDQMDRVPSKIWKLKKLTELGFSEEILSNIPADIANLTNLKVLDVYENNLTSLPPEIGKLTNLEKLDLEHNYLKSLPPEIGNLKHLKYLNLSWNKLSSLPPEIGKLTNLRALNLETDKYCNHISVLPKEIGNLTNLNYLNLIGNRLKTLPPQIGRLISLRELYLSSNDLISLPPEIGKLTNLQSLDLSRNKLTSLPTDIANLKNLKYLVLYYNSFSDAEIEKIKQLLPNCQVKDSMD